MERPDYGGDWDKNSTLEVKNSRAGPGLSGTAQDAFFAIAHGWRTCRAPFSIFNPPFLRRIFQRTDYIPLKY